MSKKSSVNNSKKTGRRLKRSVRRSLAAVLMITAIGVAAIPVPETLATGEDVTPPDTEDVTCHDMTGYGYKEDNTNDIIFIPASSNFKANCYSGVDITALNNAGTNDGGESGTIPTDGKPNYYASYKIIDDFYDANEPIRASLNWEFMYYVATVPGGNGTTSSTGGVIFKYNSAYSASQINLTSFPVTEYYTLTPAEFDAYYSNDITDTAHTALINGDKAKYPTNLDPAAKITYTYANFLKEKSGNQLEYIINEYEAKFLTEYCRGDYETKKNDFQKYYDYLQYDEAVNAGATEAELAQLVKPDDTYPREQPDNLEIIPSEKLTDGQKLKYLCDFSTNPKLSGGELREVHDDRQPRANATTAGAGTVYVVYSPEKGYIPKTTSERSMVAIGDGAFKGVGNVTNMTIPDKIIYIGNEAFADATLMTEIHIMNAYVIGNRAFKGCTSLSKVELGKGTAQIGAECFSNTAIGTMEFPQTTTKIGYGAFSKCTKLETIKLNLINTGSGCEIGDYAFYNCNALKNVEMDAATITEIGKGAFATQTGGSLESIVLPQNDLMVRADSLGDYLFAGSTTLKSVVFPRSYGSEKWAVGDKIPSAMFHQCRNLSYVEFPAKNPSPMFACGYANYDPDKLFIDVMDENFYVRGPEQSATTPEAVPRTCTWDAKTAVSNVVPYAYADAKGTEFFEMSNGDYLKCVRKNPDGATGVITKWTLKPGLTTLPKNIPLIIEEKVGNIKITALADGCFSDENLNKEVVSLDIADNSITGIGNAVFKGWPKLKRVYIGNSVNSIGNEAFAGCNKLEDVTFSPPLIGYDNFTIGRDAFNTGSEKLTFRGDIVKGYKPFDYAMDPNTIIKEPEKIRICYKSLAPSYLTVMYNPHTDMVTLLDYPKYNQVSSTLDDIYAGTIAKVQDENKGNWIGKYVDSYETLREYELYRQYNNENNDARRKVFANEWNDIVKGNVADASAAKKALYESDSYGPWINPEFCDPGSSSYWLNFVSTADSGSESGDDDDQNPITPTETEDQNNALNTLTDWLFEPIIAYALDDPIPYFEYGEDPRTGRGGNHYDVVNNQESTDLWRATTGEEGTLLEATEKIVVPNGVDSIDIYGYIKNLTADGEESTNKIFDNKYNAQFYLYGYPYYGCWDKETENMYTVNGHILPGDEDTLESVAGLFSGSYDDKASDEKYKRGNDRVREITLNSVQYLPDYAFDSCERLTTVILGPKCKDIGTAPFRGCTALKTVGDNDYYKTNNGIVYSVNPDGSYTIEECLPARGVPGMVGEAEVSLRTDENLGKVSVIKDGAFEDCDSIGFVDLTKTAGLTAIPKNCFRDCNNLTRLNLPATVNSIEEGAFAGARFLTELVIPGKEVFISGSAFSVKGDNDATTTFYTSEDSSAKRYVDEYKLKYKLAWEKLDHWRVIFLDADLNQIGDAQTVKNGETADIPPDPVKEDWVFTGWRGTNNADPGKPITEDTTFVAIGYSTNSMVNGKYKVDFIDQIDGAIFNTQLVEPGGDAIAPQAPTHAGYSFLKYGGDELTNIQKNSVALAMYSGGAGTGTGGNGTTSGSTTQGDSVSGNSTSSTSTGAESVGKYTVTVINGSGSGTYDAGTTVIIAANTPATGKVFKNWTTESAGVTFASVSLSATTFVMPSNNVTVTANYVNGSGNSVAGTSTNGNTGNGNNGGTRVDITKPGISNKDLATANVNGSTDNFVVKISETPEATQAVVNALTNKYGNLDSVLYYAMDISLYDSTGTVKISDTTGLTVDITIPIPDALTVFGGNNMAGAVVAGDQLEDLSEKFSTINGVPCISFTATHFSPYTIYVNTQQLSDGALDITPKTGDPIHPKWFLSLGLACLSIILFMKKDKKPVKVKTA